MNQSSERDIDIEYNSYETMPTYNVMFSSEVDLLYKCIVLQEEAST
jgi:hypothetical protein